MRLLPLLRPPPRPWPPDDERSLEAIQLVEAMHQAFRVRAAVLEAAVLVMREGTEFVPREPLVKISLQGEWTPVEPPLRPPCGGAGGLGGAGDQADLLVPPRDADGGVKIVQQGDEVLLRRH